MKNIFKTIIITMVIGQWSLAIAQTPQGIPYQAVARNASGNLIANQNVSLRFSIHDVTAGGTIVYRETQSATTNALGLFSVNIGQGTPVTGTFAAINWGSGAKFTQVEIDVTGGITYVDMGTQQMMSVPYALHSGNGNSAGNNTGDMLYWNGAAWVLIPVGNAGDYLQLSSTKIPTWKALTLSNLLTNPVTNITATSASCDVNILYGGSLILQRGICWSTTPNPDTLDAKTTELAPYGNPDYYLDFMGPLLANTTYYVRAYAVDVSGGLAFGNEVIFTTMSGVVTLTTNTPTNVFGLSAVSGGDVTNEGGSGVNFRGICWDTNNNPTTALSTKTVVGGGGTFGFTNTMTSLLPGTTYYVRAYATNGVGTYYGNEQTFTTQSGGIITVTTSQANCATLAVASGGTITSNGVDPVTARGVCFSTSPNPTIANSTTSDGSGTGSYSSIVAPGFAPNTTYYVRAYAQSFTTTFYGTDVTFTTPPTFLHNIGESFGGGIVFYVSCSGQHGLIAATSDQSTGVKWHNGSFINTGATAVSVSTGQANTTTIVAAQGAGTYAASVCDNLVTGGFSDWFLPSIDELALLYQQRAVVGGFVFANYWSSTEEDVNFAMKVSFFSVGGGDVGHFAKSSTTPRVRAIRAF